VARRPRTFASVIGAIIVLLAVKLIRHGSHRRLAGKPCCGYRSTDGFGGEDTMTPVKGLILGAVLFCAGAAGAETLTCRAAEAWRLDAGGLVPHPKDFYGFAATADLRADPEAGTLSAGSNPIAGMRLRSRSDAATGADLVFSTDDGTMLFRAPVIKASFPFFLIDTYDIYVGTCEG
jgi:hypothetical protein